MTGPEWMIVITVTQVLACWVFRLPLRRMPAAAFWGRAAWMVPIAAGVDAIRRQWWPVGGEGIAELIVLALWWWHSRRKGRKRAASLLGAKSRALRDALVKRARELARPRAVLAPGGAR